jgi:hypothetical protein
MMLRVVDQFPSRYDQRSFLTPWCMYQATAEIPGSSCRLSLVMVMETFHLWHRHHPPQRRSVDGARRWTIHRQ